MGMCWGFCQDIFYDSICEFSGSLILFENDGNLKAGFNIATIRAIHDCSFFDFKIVWDRYKSDHTPRFDMSLSVLNFKLFEFTIYYLFHRSSYYT